LEHNFFYTFISVNTVITDTSKFKGWVCYDAECRFCIRLAKQFSGTLAGRQFELVPLQAPWVRERLGLDDEPPEEMRLLKPDGKTVGGADALIEIGREFWWAWPFRGLGRIPAIMRLYRAGYRWVARNRGCAGGECDLDRRTLRFASGVNGAVVIQGGAQGGVGPADVLLLVALPLLTLLCQTHLAPWVFMWGMAFALYAGCKWLTYRVHVSPDMKLGRARVLGYLLAWPGMNGAEFFNQDDSPTKPHKTEWALAMAKTLFGMALLWGIARMALPVHPLLAGWIGMVGATFILHFGSFHLLSLTWRRAGVKATPMMQNPLAAKSLADFWGRRWNTAFNELALRFAFRPLSRWTTPAVAMLAVFGLSGLIHELVISLPAHGGYGLPTL